MNITELYPSSFDNSAQSFTALMRSLLIKGSYDSVLKKMTGYKGMYLNHQTKECWTLKFEQFAGVFGIVLTEVKGAFGIFHLYYYPSCDEALIDKFSLAEGLLAQESDFIEKVRSFSSHEVLLSHFHIATLSLHVNFVSQNLLLFYETMIRDRVYAKEGVKSPFNRQNYLIEPKGLDKDLPAFRMLLPVMNFLNTTITRLTSSSPSYFQLFKAQNCAMMYDKKGVFEKKKDSSCLGLYMALGYGDTQMDALVEPLLRGKVLEVVHEKMSLNTFLQKAPWYDITQELSSSSSIKQPSLKPKLVVITGFLGSGKTNLLQHYIEYETEKNRFVGIIQNEIGKTGLDGRLVDYDYSMVELDEGCVCCSLSGQLRSGIHSLMKKAYPDTILLETTGVANPFNLLAELNELEDLVDLEAIVTVVDGPNALEVAKEYRIFNDQIRAADLILLNKTDMMSEAEMLSVEEFLHENNRCASIIRTVGADVHPNILHQYVHASTAHIASLISEEDEMAVTHLEDNISSMKISLPKALSKSHFQRYLKSLPKTIFRLKGIVQFEDEPTQSIVQYIKGEYTFLAQHEENNNETFLVYIGKHVGESFIPSPSHFEYGYIVSL